MSMEDPGEAGTRPATPAWPPSSGASEAASIPTPVRVDSSEPDGDNEEEFEQFDWDSWQPGAVGDDDGPVADEVDWDAVPVSQAVDWETVPLADDPPEPTSWRELVIGESEWPRGITVSEREPLAEPVVPLPAGGTPDALLDEEDELEPVPTSLAEPLLASGGAWPPAGAVSHDIVHVRVAPWAPFTTGLALAVAMVLVSAAILSQTGRLGLTLAVLTGQVPTSADAVVDAYLGAIERGDAGKAASYLSPQPTTTTLLTDEVLRKSNELSPFTIVNVKSGLSDLNGTQKVTATYKIGDVVVSTAFTTAFTEGQWVIREDPGRIGVGSLRASGIPLFINGQEVPAGVDSLPAFPGTYELSTENPYISFTSPSTLVVRSSDEAPIIGAVKLEMTPAGRQAALDAVRTAVAACLAQKDLQPDGCPQNIESSPNEPPIRDTIVYTAKDESSSITSEDLRLAVVKVAYKGSWLLDVKVNVSGTPRDVPFSFDVNVLWQVTMSTSPPVAVLKS